MHDLRCWCWNRHVWRDRLALSVIFIFVIAGLLPLRHRRAASSSSSPGCDPAIPPDSGGWGLKNMVRLS